MLRRLFFFFFNDTATTEIYTLSLHDALPICDLHAPARCHLIHLGLEDVVDLLPLRQHIVQRDVPDDRAERDRKSTRLNSSHGYISYAVFCLKKKNNSGASGHALCLP